MIDKMVDRFLGWKLPKEFAPDGGISFEEKAWWPIGTNLLTADQAKQMFEHAVGGDLERLIDENNNLRSHRDELIAELAAIKAPTGSALAEAIRRDGIGC